MINVALPKGRLGERAYEAFASAGYDCPAILEKNRRLTFENREKGVRYFWVKPSDVSIYVERGAADVGVAGRDILLEYEPDVYELLDLGIGRCRMCVAGPENFYDAPGRTLRVATKFPHITAEHWLMACSWENTSLISGRPVPAFASRLWLTFSRAERTIEKL